MITKQFPYIQKFCVLALCAITIVFGVTIILYATVFRSVVRARNSVAISAVAMTYSLDVAQLSQAQIDCHFYRAYEHNAFIYGANYHGRTVVQGQWLGEAFPTPDYYTELLNVGGVMARLVIPTINVDLPVLHGTTPDVMIRGVGHLEGTSLPTGGYGTHTVLTTHSGKFSATLFSRLHELDIGDTFTIYVLDRQLVYKVDSIIVILPHEIEHLRVDPDADLVTLITCTPIYVNTHRLLVRGVRLAT